MKERYIDEERINVSNTFNNKSNKMSDYYRTNKNNSSSSESTITLKEHQEENKYYISSKKFNPSKKVNDEYKNDYQPYNKYNEKPYRDSYKDKYRDNYRNNYREKERYSPYYNRRYDKYDIKDIKVEAKKNIIVEVGVEEVIVGIIIINLNLIIIILIEIIAEKENLKNLKKEIIKKKDVVLEKDLDQIQF